MPRSALTISSAGDIGVRYVGDGDKVHFVKVQIVEDMQDTMWLSGVPDGARVIVRGQDFVREGQVVATVDAVAESAGQLQRDSAAMTGLHQLRDRRMPG